MTDRKKERRPGRRAAIAIREECGCKIRASCAVIRALRVACGLPASKAVRTTAPDPINRMEERVDDTTVQDQTQERANDTMHGADADRAQRPGVPMETKPKKARGARWETPARQRGADQHLHRAGLDRATPIVGTAQPPRGLSGALRRSAYHIPEHFARHWLLLMLADRVDVMENRLGELLEQPLRSAGLDDQADRVSANPLPAVAGVLFGMWLLKKSLT